jgi:hypothetical protein
VIRPATGSVRAGVSEVSVHTVVAVGEGPLPAVLVTREPMSYHGIPGLAWRLRLRLPDGRSVEAIQMGSDRPAIPDPRYRLLWEPSAGAGPRR